MYALFAALVAIAVIAMMWRFLERESSSRDEQERPQLPRPSIPRRSPKPRMVAPDDNPDFLRELSKQIDKDRNDEPRPDGG